MSAKIWWKSVYVYMHPFGYYNDVSRSEKMVCISPADSVHWLVPKGNIHLHYAHAHAMSTTAHLGRLLYTTSQIPTRDAGWSQYLILSTKCEHSPLPTARYIKVRDVCKDLMKIRIHLYASPPANTMTSVRANKWSASLPQTQSIRLFPRGAFVSIMPTTQPPPPPI